MPPGISLPESVEQLAMPEAGAAQGGFVSASPQPAPPIDEERRGKSPGLQNNFYDISTADFKRPHGMPAGYPDFDEVAGATQPASVDADAERAKGEVQGVGAVAAADDVGVELEGGAEFGLEGGHVPPSDEGGLLEHLVHGPVELGPESRVQPLQVDHVDGARRRLRTGRVHRQEAKIARTLAA